jgi:hypothetical protein
MTTAAISTFSIQQPRNAFFWHLQWILKSVNGTLFSTEIAHGVVTGSQKLNALILTMDDSANYRELHVSLRLVRCSTTNMQGVTFKILNTSLIL